MLASIASTLLLSGIAQSPAPLSGIWATKENQVYVFNGNYATFHERDRFGFLDIDRETPNGETWYASSWGPEPRFRMRDRRFLRLSTVRGDEKFWSWGKEYIIVPENPQAIHWWKYTPIRSGFGNVKFERDNNNLVRAETQLTYLGELDKIWFEGKYQYDTTIVDVFFGESGFVEGTLGYLGDKWLIQFQMKGATGRFDIVHPKTGNKEGEGFIQWAPTSTFVANMRRSNRTPASDQMLLFFKLSVKNMPNGFRALIRKI